MRPRRSLRARLLAAIGLVALLSVALAFAIGAVLTRRAVERGTLRDLSAQADLIAVRERRALQPLRHLRRLEPFLQGRGERALAVPIDGSSPFLPPERAREVRHGRRVADTVTVDGTRYFVAARLVAGKGFALVRPTSRVESAWRPHLEGLLAGALAGLALAGLAAFLLARAISGPLARLAAAARTLPRAEAPPRVPVEGSRELATLAVSFNETAEQLARARTAERSFLLSVSHELKTPLTAIRGYAEAVAEGVVPIDEAVETIGREAERLERLVHDLLDLARMNKSEFAVRRDAIDLGDAAREVVRRHRPLAERYGVSVELDAGESAPALGDGDRVLQIASNLVENALRLTPPGGAVRVVAAPGRLSVEDTGPGLEPDDLPRAFDRFYLHSRYGRDRPVGTGLGLAIVKQLAEGMSGSVEVESDPGRLTRFTVRLPLPATGERERREELASV